MTKKQQLIKILQGAKSMGIDYVAVSVQMEGSEQPEIIVNHLSSTLFKKRTQY